MAKPSRNTDQLLIEAAKELIPKTGCSGLNLRQVADKARVNLGMFHYHFKTKDEFTRQVLQEIYDDFFKELCLEVEIFGTPEVRLRGALTVLGRFSRDQRALLVALIRDILNEDQEVIKFFKKNFGKHFKLILGLVNECKTDGTFQSLPAPLILVVLLATVGFPHLAVDFLERSKIIPRLSLKKIGLNALVMSESALQIRINLAISAVSRRKSQ